MVLDVVCMGCEVYVWVKMMWMLKLTSEGEAKDETLMMFGFGVDGGFVSESDKYDVDMMYVLVIVFDFDDVLCVLFLEGLLETFREACEKIA